MTVIRAQVTLSNTSSPLPRDTSVNTWHFGSSAPLTSQPEIHTALEVFYAAIDTYLAGNVAATAAVKYYDLSDAEPRTPFATDTIAISSGSGTYLPNECAICMSYRADIISGGNQARRRGRIFLGPIDADATVTRSGDIGVSSTARTAICNAAKALAETAIASSVGWVVFSPTTAGSPPWAGGTLDDSSYPVTAGWVDDAMDTIRSRGLAAVARTSWVAA